MNQTEDSVNSSPSGVMFDSLSQLAKDVVALAELQTELLKVDMRDWIRGCLVPVVVLAIVAATASLASLPLLLLSLAYCLAEFAGLSMALSALISAGVGLVLAGICLIVAWQVLKRQRGAFTRFKIELARNIRWLKQVATRPRETAENEPW